MNNVWLSIAVRPMQCVRSQQTRPLLQLFCGYAREQRRLQCNAVAATRNRWRGQRETSCRGKSTQLPPLPREGILNRSFSSSGLLSARNPKPKRPPPPTSWNADAQRRGAQPESPAKVEPAPTVATHTEGLPIQEEEKGLTWRDYDPEGGMPLPGGELSAPDIHGIFGGEDVDVDTGNYILSVMLWRRMSGAMIDAGLDFPPRSGVTREQALRALIYIRKLDPTFDEQAAGQQWVEEETVRLRQEIHERSVKLGIYRADEEEEIEQGTPEGRALTEESVLKTVRQQRDAEWEREQAQKAAQAKREEAAALHRQRGPLDLAGGVQPSASLIKLGSNSVAIGRAPQSATLEPFRERPWVKYYEERANLLKDNIIPQTSTTRRLLPSFAFVLAILAGCYYLSENYTPPPKSARIFPDISPSTATIGTITALIGTTFIVLRFPSMYRAANKYFAVVPALPHPYSMVGAIFRHDTLYHLAINLAFFWGFAPALHHDVGRGTFLAIFLASGALSSFTSLAYHVVRSQWQVWSIGASGAVLGVAAAICTIRPTGTVKVGTEWEIPFAAWPLLIMFVAAEIVAVRYRLTTDVDHWGHIGGLASGILAGLAVRWKSQRQGMQWTAAPAHQPSLPGNLNAGIIARTDGEVANGTAG